MFNSLLFIIAVIVVLAFVLVVFRWGHVGLSGLVMVLAVLANIYVVKGMVLFGLNATGGNIMYAAIFFCTDLLSEFHGKKAARTAVWMGFAAAFFFLVTSQITLAFQPADYDIAHDALVTIFALTPRIVIGSLIAYVISQNIDVTIFHWIKTKTGGRHLWLRNNGSTWISQLVDSIVFTTIAFAGIYPLLQMILFTYVLKVIIAALDTPFLYLAKHFAKNHPDYHEVIAG